MDNLLSVAFEAHNVEKNHHRHYRVTVGRDPARRLDGRHLLWAAPGRPVGRFAMRLPMKKR